MAVDQSLTFLIQGSSAEPYSVEITKAGGIVAISCTCPAGINGTHCKHRLSILDGKVPALVSGNHADVATARSWLEGTELQRALDEYLGLEEAAENIKKMLAKSKKTLARAMAGAGA